MNAHQFEAVQRMMLVLEWATGAFQRVTDDGLACQH
jgi:hypothetical protein